MPTTRLQETTTAWPTLNSTEAQQSRVKAAAKGPTKPGRKKKTSAAAKASAASGGGGAAASTDELEAWQRNLPSLVTVKEEEGDFDVKPVAQIHRVGIAAYGPLIKFGEKDEHWYEDEYWLRENAKEGLQTLVTHFGAENVFIMMTAKGGDMDEEASFFFNTWQLQDRCGFLPGNLVYSGTDKGFAGRGALAEAMQLTIYIDSDESTIADVWQGHSGGISHHLCAMQGHLICMTEAEEQPVAEEDARGEDGEDGGEDFDGEANWSRWKAFKSSEQPVTKLLRVPEWPTDARMIKAPT